MKNTLKKMVALALTFGLALGVQAENVAATTDPTLVPAESLPVAIQAACQVVSSDKTTTNKYTTLEEAVAALKASEKITFTMTLLKDGLTTEGLTLDLSGKKVTIDLNGCVLTNGTCTIGPNDGTATTIVIKNGVAGQGGLVISGTVNVKMASGLDLTALSWTEYGKGGLVLGNTGALKLAYHGWVTFNANNQSPNWMAANYPDFLSQCATGAWIDVGNDNYEKGANGWTIGGAVATAEIAGTGSYGQPLGYVESFTTAAAALAAVTNNGSVTMVDNSAEEQGLTIRETTTLDLTASGYTIATNGLVNKGVIKVYQAHLDNQSLEAYANVVGTLLAGSEIKDASSTMSYPKGTTINLTEETLASGNIVPTVTVNVPAGTLVWKNGVGPYKQMFVYGNVTYAGNLDAGLSAEYKTLLSVVGDVEIVSSITISNNAAMAVTGTVTLTPEDETTITLADETSTFVNNGELTVDENVRAAADGYGVFRSADGVYSVYRPTVTYSWQPTEVGTVVASNSLDGSTTQVESGAAVAYGSQMQWLAIPTFSNAERYEFVEWTVAFNGVSQESDKDNPVTRTLTEENVTNYDYTASFQWKSNYTGTVEVKGSPVWDVREGEDYSTAIVSISEGGTFSSKFENALNGIQVATDGTLVWDFTEGGAPSFSPVRTVTCVGTFKIAFDGTLTNGTYAIMSYNNLSGTTADSFALTDGVTTKTCTANGDWVYFGAYRFKITDKDNLVSLVVEANPRTCFVTTQYEVQEGRSVKVYIQGGSSDRAVQTTVTYQKNTGSYSAAYVDGKKVTFPLTLNWAKGEISEKEILFQTAKTTKSGTNRFFTLQLGSEVGETTLEEHDVCTVTIVDSGADVDYARVLAYPAHGGTVSGGGQLAIVSEPLYKGSSLKRRVDRRTRTLTAKPKNGSLFAGWYAADPDDPSAIDFGTLLSTASKLRVGLNTAYGPGTYFAYFTNVLEVAAVVEPVPFADDEGTPAPGVKGVTGWDSFGTYATMVGVKFALPVAFTDASGKGKLAVSKLPSGLSLKKTTDRVTKVVSYTIAGIPTKAGTYAAKFVASNAAGKHTVNYTFEVAPLPTVAVGTFAGVVTDDGARAGVGSVAFTAGKTGALSAKVTRRLSGARSFSVKGYDYLDAETLGIAMTNKLGEVFEGTLSLTNGWYDTAVEGRAFGGTKKGTLGKNGETNGVFVALRNAFSTADKTAEEYAQAQQTLTTFLGTYSETLYATNGLGQAEAKVGTVQYRVNKKGSVYVAAKLLATQDGAKAVAKKTFTGTVAGGFGYDLETGLGAAAAALRSGTSLWSTEVLFDYEELAVKGQARYIRPNAETKTEVVDVDEFFAVP